MRGRLRKGTLGLSSALVILLAACGAEDWRGASRDSDSGNDSPKDVGTALKGTPTPRPKVSPSASPTPARAPEPEKASGLFRLDVVEANGTTRPCSGFHIGQGRVATAAHCVQSLKGGTCASGVTLRSILLEPTPSSASDAAAAAESVSALPLSKTRLACASGVSYFSAERGETSDFAVLTLAPESLPKALPTLSLREAPRAVYFLVWIFGPHASNPDAFSQDYGNALTQTAETQTTVTFRATYGFSGTPLLAETPEESGSAPKALATLAEVEARLKTGVIGMHVSSSGSQKIALTAKRIQELLSLGSTSAF